ncbi:hypothetical protein DE146DRAFT_10329 [Phaeosphaeria sp. MPI-PUGE-AT-0046c]|nr:hypothetical protein DE146DRAFT_10329 [Phaeosphaeria sp. MPI-PUGE-AT-0046c]
MQIFGLCVVCCVVCIRSSASASNRPNALPHIYRRLLLMTPFQALVSAIRHLRATCITEASARAQKVYAIAFSSSYAFKELDTSIEKLFHVMTT